MSHHDIDGNSRSRIPLICSIVVLTLLALTTPHELSEIDSKVDYRSKFPSFLQWLGNGNCLVVAKGEEFPVGQVLYVRGNALPIVRIVVD